MDWFKWLGRSLVALLMSVLCIGGGTAISIVGVVNTSGQQLNTIIGGGVALAIFGGYLVLLISPYRSNIKLSAALRGISFDFSKREDALGVKPPAGRVFFGSLAMLCTSVICAGCGIALSIVAVANAKATTGIPMVPLLGGVVQTLFGGYLAMMAVGTSPVIKASGDFQEGIALELTEK